MKAKRKTQCERLLHHLRKRRSITWHGGFHLFGISFLGRRIYDLRHGKFDGRCWDIRSTTVRVGARYGRKADVSLYWLNGRQCYRARKARAA